MLPSDILGYNMFARYEPYGDGALNRSSQPAAHLAWTKSNSAARQIPPNWSQHVHRAASSQPKLKVKMAGLEVYGLAFRLNI